jgi:hypothetical protein
MDKKISLVRMKPLRWIGPSKDEGIQAPKNVVELIERRQKLAIEAHAKRSN